MYYAYIVTNKHDSVLYIGVTSNLEGRIYEHRERLTEGFTKKYQATKLIYYEDYPDPTSAIAREKREPLIVRDHSTLSRKGKTS